MGLAGLIAVARGDEVADLLLANARMVNVFTGKVERGNVAIFEDRIAGIGGYSQGKKTVDLKGKFLAPGLIDGHTHLESSNLNVGEYARAVVARGTTAVVTDLHEIANVCGLPGIRYMMAAARRVPLDVFLMVPPCVPATRLETSGAEMRPEDIRAALKWPGTLGVGEFMDFPGVLRGNLETVQKLDLPENVTVDGHAPRLSGKDLNAYVAAGVRSDHECTSAEEAKEKLARGMWIMIRQGSSGRDLERLLPLVTDETYAQCLFVSDDRTCVDLLRDGDMDAVVRDAVALGMEPVRAIRLASLNPASYFGLKRMGAVAPGYLANLVVVGDLREFRAEMVFWHGRLVAGGGKPVFSVGRPGSSRVTGTMRVKPFGVEALRLFYRGGRFPVIEVVPGQLPTRKVEIEPKSEDGVIIADPERGLLKLAVVERHRATGNIGLGLVKGFGLCRGALASSVAHDSHNIVAVGASDQDLFVAIKRVEEMGGGLAVSTDGNVLGSLPLPIAGLLSKQPLEHVVSKLEMLEHYVARLGCKLNAPFAVLSFLALPVIPEIRLTDLGLVDVEQAKVISP